MRPNIATSIKKDNSGDDGSVAWSGCSARLLAVFAAARQLVVDGLIRFVGISVVPHFGNSFADGVDGGFRRIVLQVYHLFFLVPMG